MVLIIKAYKNLRRGEGRADVNSNIATEIILEDLLHVIKMSKINFKLWDTKHGSQKISRIWRLNTKT